MSVKKLIFVIVILCANFCSYAQWARIKGVILDAKNQPLPNVNISSLGVGTYSSANGYYSLRVPANQKITVYFQHVSYKNANVSLELNTNEVYEFNLVMNQELEQIGEVVIVNGGKRRLIGITSIDPEVMLRIPGANAGIENILKTLAGVNSNNELSTQYSVRGGNYDENLVYVNEIEIYRPFLIRSGQQEGLSFTNTDLVQNVNFSAGGFQAKYGDKLSSVLDITYRVPVNYGAKLESSFLGGSLSVDAVSNDKKWTAITGVRYRNNSLLVKSQDTETNYTPSFVDVQTNVNFRASEKWTWNFLGNISQNNYNYQPLTRKTRFGTLEDPKILYVFYNGQEQDKYETYFGALKSTFKVSDQLIFKFIGSVFHTLEQEHFDILGQYRLGDNETTIGSENFGGVSFASGIGSQLNHARNDLDALIGNTEIKAFFQKDQNNIEFGLKYTKESIRDRIAEWEVIDSAGFSVRPPIISLVKKDEPYSVYTGPLLPFQNIRAVNYNTVNRFYGFWQWSRRGNIGGSVLWFNAGVRMHSWQFEGADFVSKSQFVFSPRMQVGIKPGWDRDILFRIALGKYNQPPFYREVRGADGAVRPNTKEQQSTHFVFGNEYSFEIWKRPFKLSSELYYKSLSNVNTYTLDNVRIRYAADNDAKAYAQGVDVRLNGEFVPGTESWFSFGYLKTEENRSNRGYIARPTDQRLKFAVLFQDYMPKIPSMKLYLNLVYNTGLPGGSPSYVDPYVYQNRLNDYRRVDIGFSKILIDEKSGEGKSWLVNARELTIGLEIFNLFNNHNAITNTWVRDVYSKNEYAIPNYMTTRLFNVKLNARF